MTLIILNISEIVKLRFHTVWWCR